MGNSDIAHIQILDYYWSGIYLEFSIRPETSTNLTHTEAVVLMVSAGIVVCSRIDHHIFPHGTVTQYGRNYITAQYAQPFLTVMVWILFFMGENVLVHRACIVNWYFSSLKHCFDHFHGHLIWLLLKTYGCMLESYLHALHHAPSNLSKVRVSLWGQVTQTVTDDLSMNLLGVHYHQRYWQISTSELFCRQKSYLCVTLYYLIIYRVFSLYISRLMSSCTHNLRRFITFE